MSQRILVIGAGVSGLTTARCLIDSGFEVIVLAAQSAELTPSIVAGALWEWPPAVCGHHTNTESLRHSKEWARSSYERFRKLASSEETGVRIVPTVFYSRYSVKDCDDEWKKMQEVISHVEQFEHSAGLIDRYGVNRELGFQDAYSYLAPIIHTSQYMGWLRRDLESRRCQFEERKLGGALTESEKELRAEFRASVILNCSGLGSIELAEDEMQPLRGALLRIRNDGSDFSRIDSAHCVAHDDTSEGQQMVYIIPRGKDHVLLGGIAESGEWDTDIDMESHPPVAGILRRCQSFMPALKEASLDDSDPIRVGLRPYRSQNVRLEQEPGYPVIHNYGHGGSGFSFSWECGEEVAALATAITGS